jgi:hypothetical protein
MRHNLSWRPISPGESAPKLEIVSQKFYIILNWHLSWIAGSNRLQLKPDVLNTKMQCFNGLTFINTKLCASVCVPQSTKRLEPQYASRKFDVKRIVIQLSMKER